MSFGPYGIGHIDGTAVLIPKVAPGDLVEAQIISKRRNYSLAQVRRIVERGLTGRVPPCPYLPECGGCDWQQINYFDQLRLKADMMVSQFRHALGIKLDPQDLVEPAPAEFGYRSRIRLMVGRSGALGYRELDGKRLVPITHCAVAAVAVEAAAELARSLAPRCREIEIVGGDAGEVLIAHLHSPVSAGDHAHAERLLATNHAVAGVILKAAGTRQVLGNVATRILPEPELELLSDADHFSQVNHAQNLKLVAAVMDLTQPHRNLAVLDLFCGSGNLSLPAARRGAIVTGVDADEPAITAARANASRLGLDAQFIAMPADGTAEFLKRAHYKPDIVIMDPPRVGAVTLMEPLARLQPGKLIYVSCDLRTLLRDVSLLRRNGYRVGYVHAFDFFPNTHHIELVVECSNQGARY